MLAAGWRTVHYFSAGVYEEPGDGKAERGDVPHAGLRRADNGHALANAKARSGTFSTRASERSRRQNSRERGDWRRSGDGAFRDAADSAGLGRDDVRRILAAGTYRLCYVADDRCSVARSCGERVLRVCEFQVDCRGRGIVV